MVSEKLLYDNSYSTIFKIIIMLLVEFVIRLTKNWFTSMEIMLLSNQWTLYSSFMLTVAQGTAKVSHKEQNRMKNVATEFAVEGGVLKRREDLQQLYINLYTKVFIPTSLVFEVVLSFGDVQERIIRHFGISISKIYTFASDELIAQIENKLLMKREDHSSAISNRPGENSKTLGKDHRTTTLYDEESTLNSC
ncbi:hypothetical protein RhiirA5_423524 [Rhizophagus irregularis]|uniref:Uncharacterized protein n=1 Tax=Rhizophagus irregularis TaxID=588596 RepID=A0A2N0R6V3_9GLOM|nr:hypothetical protein RhiirA5_423524 [Rhizophagus irregularis]PKC59021.1 hypothetical protein RhiirA1_470058 [Rhizophagus irregularis]